MPIFIFSCKSIHFLGAAILGDTLLQNSYDLSRTYEKLYCKGESYWFSGSLVDRHTHRERHPVTSIYGFIEFSSCVLANIHSYFLWNLCKVHWIATFLLNFKDNFPVIVRSHFGSKKYKDWVAKGLNMKMNEFVRVCVWQVWRRKHESHIIVSINFSVQQSLL